MGSSEETLTRDYVMGLMCQSCPLPPALTALTYPTLPTSQAGKGQRRGQLLQAVVQRCAKRLLPSEGAGVGL